MKNFFFLEIQVASAHLLFSASVNVFGGRWSISQAPAASRNLACGGLSNSLMQRRKNIATVPSSDTKKLV